MIQLTTLIAEIAPLSTPDPAHQTSQHATLFQIILVAGAAFLLIATIVAVIKGWATRREGLLWAVVCVAAGVTVSNPGIIGKLAKGLGIGRGADLLLYIAVVVMLIGFLMVYTRLRQIRREMTLLVRELAIRDAVTSSQTDTPDGRHAT